MKTIKKVGVIGAGTMGAALAQKFAQEGFQVVLADREMKFVEKGISGITSMLNEGIERKVFTEEKVKVILNHIEGADDLHKLIDCDLVVEAIFESMDAKKDLFKNLSEILPSNTIIATNTSSFSVTELSASVKNPERFIGLHYFFHAAKNRLVEIIPGEKTTEDTIRSAYRFCVNSGKDPIYTKDAYGFAVNRFFVPWLNESVKLLAEGIGTIEEIDSVCMKVFGIGMGPFALMNATGVPIALHAQRTLEFFGPSYKVSKRLEEQVDKKEDWTIGNMEIIVPDSLAKRISDRMLGCTFFVCTQILEEEVCSAVDLNKGAKIGLRWRKGPIDLMNQNGIDTVNNLINRYAQLYKEKIPILTEEMLKMDLLTLEIVADRAIIMFNRPEDLNALNEEVMRQLNEKFSEANNNSVVKTIFITGSGKAFVAGADIKFFIKNIQTNSLNKIIEFTRFGQEVFDKIDRSSKTVVALLNGMALGGGMELALCADYIFAVPKAVIAFPETGIGIYPGLGGTQRSRERVGEALAKYLIFTGKMHNAAQCSEIGLIDGVLTTDQMFDMIDGNLNLPQKTERILSDKWQSIQDLYGSMPYTTIMDPDHFSGTTVTAEVETLGKIMRSKAPVAMKIANLLIEEAKGPESELVHLTKIFSTSDALLGLSSIGKRVEYQGK